MQFIQHNNVFKTSVKLSWTFHLMLNIFILSIHFKFEHIFTIEYIPMLYQLLAKIYSKTFAKIVISFRQHSLYTSFLHSFLYWTKWEKKDFHFTKCSFITQKISNRSTYDLISTLWLSKQNVICNKLEASSVFKPPSCCFYLNSILFSSNKDYIFFQWGFYFDFGAFDLNCFFKRQLQVQVWFNLSSAKHWFLIILKSENWMFIQISKC